MAKPRLHRVSPWRRSRASRHVEDVQDSTENRMDTKEASNHRSPTNRMRSSSRRIQQGGDGGPGVEITKDNCKGTEDSKASGWAWILKSLRESRGLALKVSDREIHRAMLNVARRDGLLVELSSAAAFAVVPKLYDIGEIDAKDSIVVIATGSGLKTLEQS